jgi:arylsulfatase
MNIAHSCYRLAATLAGALLATTALAQSNTAEAQPDMDRTHLPVKEPTRPTYTELDARNATPPPRFVVKPPAGAPNVVIVLVDDVGFGGPGTFGGPINTPMAITPAMISAS